jgi:hypothetical protein
VNCKRGRQKYKRERGWVIEKERGRERERENMKTFFGR